MSDITNEEVISQMHDVMHSTLRLPACAYAAVMSRVSELCHISMTACTLLLGLQVCAREEVMSKVSEEACQRRMTLCEV